jgi:hypothetical protein
VWLGTFPVLDVLLFLSQVVTVERGLLVIGGRPLPKGNEMKIRHPRFVGLVIASAVSLASIAVSAVAAETPFKGTVDAVETTTQVAFPTSHWIGRAAAPPRISAGTRST